MSQSAHATDAHGHGAAHGGDHVPHVLPLAAYLGVFSALLVFTVLTVAVSYIDLGPANIVIALAVATCKALMVALIFMHLAFDKKFNTVIFASSLLFLAIFIGFVLIDTGERGLGGRTSADGPADVANPFGGTRSEEEIKAKFAPAKENAEGPKHNAHETAATPEPAHPTEGTAPAAPAPEGK